jgi:hypothetical protein
MAFKTVLYVVNFGPKNGGQPSYVQVASLALNDESDGQELNNYMISNPSSVVSQIPKTALVTFRAISGLYPSGLYKNVEKYFQNAQKLTNQIVVQRWVGSRLYSAQEIADKFATTA